MHRLLPALLLIGLLAAADEIRLADGRILEGEVTSAEGADPLLILVTSGRVSAEIHVPRKDVVEIRRGGSDRQKRLDQIEVRISAAALGMDAAAAAELWACASDLASLGQVIRQREVLQLVIDRDRHHPEARAVLGFKLHRGVWMRPNEIAAAEGRVLHEGKWLTWAEYQAAIAAAQAAAAQRQERQAQRDEERQQRERDRAIRQAVQDTSRLEPIYSGPSSSYYSRDCRDSLLYRYYWGALAGQALNRSSSTSSSRSCGGSSLSFQFGGSNWGVKGTLGY